MATKRAVAMAIRVMGGEEGHGKDGKSNAGNGTKRAIARKRAMESNDDNKTMATETMTQHCCCHHHCPCLSHCCFDPPVTDPVTLGNGSRYIVHSQY